MQLARSESASAGSGFSWKPWTRPSASVIDDAELAHVGDPLDGQRGDAVVGVVGGAQGAEVDVGERVAGHHEEAAPSP